MINSKHKMGRCPFNIVEVLACCLEEHENTTGHHYYLCAKLLGCKWWNHITKNLKKNHQIIFWNNTIKVILLLVLHTCSKRINFEKNHIENKLDLSRHQKLKWFVTLAYLSSLKQVIKGLRTNFMLKPISSALWRRKI